MVGWHIFLSLFKVWTSFHQNIKTWYSPVLVTTDWKCLHFKIWKNNKEIKGIKTRSDGSAEDQDYEVQSESMKVDHSPPVQNESQSKPFSGYKHRVSWDVILVNTDNLKIMDSDCDKRFVLH